MSPRGVSRRGALIGAGAAAAACAHADEPAPGPPALFAHGVASGDPVQDRVVIWTRASPASDRAVDVSWTVARDRDLTDVVASGTARAEAARDFTVKADVGGLDSGAGYFYGFAADGARSPVGRTRTLPDGATPEFKLAVVSCSDFAAGWFHVYRDVAERSDVDAVVHLGDAIYEHGPGGGTDGEDEAWPRRRGRLHAPPKRAVSLSDYRTRWAQYRSDPDLQAAHAAHPWIAIWDDHESVDNATRDGALEHAPEHGGWPARRRAALQAYFEWTPIREPVPGRAREAAWRTFRIGDLASLIMLETRLTARSPEVTWDDVGLAPDADPDDPEDRARVEAFLRDVVGDPKREMLGPAQLADVEAALAASVRRGEPWRLLGNQTIMARLVSPDLKETLPAWLRVAAGLSSREARKHMNWSRFKAPPNLDQWDGFPAERERLYAAARAANAQLLTLTGDTHCFFVNRLTTESGAAAGVEIGASSVTSPSAFDGVMAPGVDFGDLIAGASPDVLHANAYDRGYVVLTLTPDRARAELRRADTVRRKRHVMETYATWEVAKGEGGALEAREVAPS